MSSVVDALVVLARQVRGRTLGILRGVEEGAMLWVPRGTVNHLVWHVGHVMWVQEVLCLLPLSGEVGLPVGWEGRFGMGSRPGEGGGLGEWPGKGELMGMLEGQMGRMEAVLRGADVGVIGDFAEPGEEREPGGGWGILHGLHDEGIHQGEMRLLLKMWRAGRNA